MKRVLILGATGMLGNTVAKYFLTQKNKYYTILTYRNKEAIQALTKKNVVESWLFSPSIKNHSLDFIIQDLDPDYVINCIGVIKPFMKNNMAESIFLNSIFPHLMSETCKKYNAGLIHITTDCVFSGKGSNYNEKSIHDALDEYGKSKSLGEPIDNAMTIRTSIIGEEVHKYASLISWAKTQKNKEVNGFVNHIWNGITTLEYAKCCDKIISNNLYNTGLYHIFSDKVTKYNMLQFFNTKWDLNMKINPIYAPEACDRSMTTMKDLCAKLQINSFEKMIEDL
jgi:dTDP-4-dehydrorhamnose reductase